LRDICALLAIPITEVQGAAGLKLRRGAQGQGQVSEMLGKN
jgi:hypothetical protein